MNRASLNPIQSANSQQQEFKLEGTPYDVDQMIGIGAYGQVRQAIHRVTGRQVAIKRIANAFGTFVLTRRTLREVIILRKLSHENIISVLDMFTAPASHGRDIYLVLTVYQNRVRIFEVMDLMETTLHRIIHSTQSLSDKHNNYFLYQILRGLKYLHSAGIVHRDLKPDNLLVNEDCLLKIADFGMARSIDQLNSEEASPMTVYPSLAPELLFSLIDYDAKVDIWSAGCIFAEMIMRRQLFPGREAAMQIKMLVYYLGTPETEVMDRITSSLIKNWIISLGPRQPLPWGTILPKATQKAVALIEQMMQVAPWKRISAEAALSHPYLELYHVSENEPTVPDAIKIDADAIEKLPLEELNTQLQTEASFFQQQREVYDIERS